MPLYSPRIFYEIGLVALLVTTCNTSSAQDNGDSDLYSPAVIATADFLRRGHQASVVAGEWLYLDGGIFSFMADGTPRYQYSSTLLSIDLSQDWTNATVVFRSTLKPDGVPNLSAPSLWYHDQEDILYLGFTGSNTTFDDTPNLPPLSLWTFKPDGAGSGTWNEVIDTNSSIWNALVRPGYALQAHGSNKAWILGGEKRVNGKWSSLGENLVEFDMEARTFKNSSVQCCKATKGIHGGNMQYVSSFGPDGLLVAFGGQIGDNTEIIDFETVSVFDPAKQEWWNQTTTGSAPSTRAEFCSAGINSTNGTYEIFVYAGWAWSSGPGAIQFDTINILTLPAFHLITVPYNPQNPRFAHSCNAVGGSQIVTIGGLDSAAKNTSVFGNMLKPDPFAQGLAIFDMTTLSFINQYIAAAPPYEQSNAVKQFYAQSQGQYLQGLTPGVAALMQTTHFTKFNDNTSPNESSASSNTSTAFTSEHKVGITVGSAVGGAIAGLLISAAAVLVILKRRKSPQSAKPTTASESTIEPRQAGGKIFELHRDARHVELPGAALQE